MINECVENHRLKIWTNFLWEIIAVLSQQFATVPLCVYAACQSEKVQMLLVPGGLVNRLHRLSPSSYSFCLAPPSLRLTVVVSTAPVVDLLDVTSSLRGTKLWRVTLLRLGVSVLLQHMFESQMCSFSENFLYLLFLRCPSCSCPACSVFVVYIPHIWSRVLPPGRYSMWWLSGPHWGSPVHQWITVHDSTALSHFLCLDINRKERIPTVVNTGTPMPHPPLSAPIHLLLHTTSVCSSLVFMFSDYKGITTSFSKMISIINFTTSLQSPILVIQRHIFIYFIRLKRQWQLQCVHTHTPEPRRTCRIWPKSNVFICV